MNDSRVSNATTGNRGVSFFYSLLFFFILTVIPSVAYPGTYGPDTFNLAKLSLTQIATISLALVFAADFALFGKVSPKGAVSLWILPVVLCLYLLARTVFSDCPPVGYRETLRIASLFGVGWLSFLIVDRKRLPYILWAVALGGFLESVIAALQFFNVYFGYTYKLFQRVPGFFGDPNSLCAYLIIPFWCGVYLVLGCKSTVKAILISIFPMGIFAAIVLTFSRSGWLCMAFSVVVFLVLGAMTGEKRPGRWKRSLPPLLFLALLSGCIALAAGRIRSENNFAQRIVSIPKFFLKGAESKDRLNLMRAAVLIVEKRPVFGAGPGSFYIEQVGAQKVLYDKGLITEPYIRAYNAYNDYLQIFAETGAVGFILYFFCIGLYAFLLFRGTRKPGGDRLFLIVVLSSMSSVILGHTAFQFPFYNSALTTVFFVLIGVALRSVVADETVAVPLPKRRMAFLVPTAALAVAIPLLIYCCAPLRGARLYQDAYLRYRAGDDWNAAYRFEKSLRIYPDNFMGYYYLGECYKRLGKLNESEASFLKATHYFPTLSLLWRNLAIVAINKRDRAAYEKYHREYYKYCFDCEETPR